MTVSVRKLRCAVYTRKSSEEGLDMEFNSLDAQREACHAYITSQRAEGWLPVPDDYDDGGVSGGTLERPALRRLLSDIEAGLVDVVVVYKIDRLSRALLDFSKLVEVFDRNKVTFVAVTQSFNTTTSMGRLTLNILLSFAQFEREVIGERIRDKVAASRKKGIWMGGPIPFGYLVESRKLSNRVYIGEAVHKEDSYPGEHKAIIPRQLWDDVHAMLKESPRARASKTRTQMPALLKGLIFAPNGQAMTPTHTRRRGKLYRYYVSMSVLKSGPESCPIGRIPAAEIEAVVTDQLRKLFRAPEVIVQTWLIARNSDPTVSEMNVREALFQFDALWDQLFPAEQARIVQLLVERVSIGAEGAEVSFRTDGMGNILRELRPAHTEQVAA
jgi:DNA invertase Pin-like site-specific DNA recombinase